MDLEGESRTWVAVKSCQTLVGAAGKGGVGSPEVPKEMSF